MSEGASVTVGIEQKRRDRYVQWVLTLVLVGCIALPLLALAWRGGTP